MCHVKIELISFVDSSLKLSFTEGNTFYVNSSPSPLPFSLLLLPNIHTKESCTILNTFEGGYQCL